MPEGMDPSPAEMGLNQDEMQMVKPPKIKQPEGPRIEQDAPDVLTKKYANEMPPIQIDEATIRQEAVEDYYENGSYGPRTSERFIARAAERAGDEAVAEAMARAQGKIPEAPRTTIKSSSENRVYETSDRDRTDAPGWRGIRPN